MFHGFYIFVTHLFRQFEWRGGGGGVGNLTKKVTAENFKGPVIGHINGLVILIWLSDNRLTEL